MYLHLLSSLCFSLFQLCAAEWAFRFPHYRFVILTSRFTCPSHTICCVPPTPFCCTQAVTKIYGTVLSKEIVLHWGEQKAAEFCELQLLFTWQSWGLSLQGWAGLGRTLNRSKVSLVLQAELREGSGLYLYLHVKDADAWLALSGISVLTCKRPRIWSSDITL